MASPIHAPERILRVMLASVCFILVDSRTLRILGTMIRIQDEYSKKVFAQFEFTSVHHWNYGEELRRGSLKSVLYALLYYFSNVRSNDERHTTQQGVDKHGNMQNRLDADLIRRHVFL